MFIYRTTVVNRNMRLDSIDTPDGGEHYPVNGNNGDLVVVTVDTEWFDANIRGLFIWNGKYYIVAPNAFDGSAYTFVVPALYNTNFFRFGIYAGEQPDDSKYLSTTPIELPCQLSIRDFATRAHDDYGDNYTDEAKKAAEEATQAAERATQDAERATQAAEEAADKAQETADKLDYSIVQTTGTSEDKVMSQKAVTDNLNFQNTEMQIEWYNRTLYYNDDGSAYIENFSDSTIRLLSTTSPQSNLYDVTGKTIQISIDDDYAYACALCKTLSTTAIKLNPQMEWQYYTEPTTWVADGDYKYLIVMIKKIDNSDILLTEASAIKIEEVDGATNEVKERILQLQEEVTNLKTASLSGKKWLFIGDSITEHNFRATKNYDEYLQDWLDIVPVNVGMSGTGVTYPFGGNPSWLDKMADYPTDIDVISVMGALNDRHTTLGEWGDRGTETVYGAVWNYFNNLINKYPNKPIVYISSTPREYSYGVDGQYTAWVDAFIKTAHNFSIPVLDLYRNSGLRPWNATHNAEYFSCSDAPTGDGVHPNEKGQKLMALKIAEFAKQYLAQ